MLGSARMANATNLHHQSTQQMNGMRGSVGTSDASTVLVHHHTADNVQQGVHHQAVVDPKSSILHQHVGAPGGGVTDIDGNFIHDILGINSQIEIIDEEVQQHHGTLQQQQQQPQGQHQQQHHHQEVIVQQHHQEHQQGGQQIQIQNATPEQLLELQQQGAYTQENGNRVIVVSELFKCDICNLAFIFKDHYIQHCDDHIRMVAEHINLKGIVPINNFEDANEVLDFRNEEQDAQQQQLAGQTIGVDGIIHNGVSHLQEQQQQQIIVHGHQQQGNNQGAVIQQHHLQQQQQHQVVQEVQDNGQHGVVHLSGGGGGVLDSSMVEDIDEGDPQLSGSARASGGGSGGGGGSGKNSKRTSQQQLQAQLNSEWCKCLPCDFKFRTPLSLSRHLNAHMENRNRCEKCNKFFTSYVSLNTHSRQCQGDEEGAEVLEAGGAANGRARSTSVDGPATSPGHPNKVYNCKKCNVQFSSANQYRDHKLTHSNDVYTCNECQRAFLSIINLNRHRQNEHQHRQTYMCMICNCEFTNVEFLEEHNKTRSHLHNLNSSTGVATPVPAGRSRPSGARPAAAEAASGGAARGADVVVID